MRERWRTVCLLTRVVNARVLYVIKVEFITPYYLTGLKLPCTFNSVFPV